MTRNTSDVLRQHVLPKLNRVKPAGGGRYKASCPIPGHGQGKGDRNPSMSVGPGNDQPVVFHCHVCQDDEALKAALVGIGIDWALVSERRDAPEAEPWLPCQRDRKTGVRRPGHHLVSEYQYVDQDGRLVFVISRCTEKDFFSWRPAPGAPHGRRWGLSDDDGNRVVPYLPYRLPQVLAAIASGRNVFICEGEADCDALAAIGIAATCNDGGTGKGWRPEHAQWLTGADAIVVADRDRPGLAHAQKVTDSLMDIARSVEVVVAAEGKDARDHLNAGLHVGKFVQIAEPKPAPTAVDGCPDCEAEMTFDERVAAIEAAEREAAE